MMNRLIVIVVLAIVGASLSLFVVGIEADPIYYTIQDINYNPDTNAVLDFYLPLPTGQPTPIVIFAHGGGFTAGTEYLDVEQEPFKSMLRQGIAVASVRYTLAPAASFVTIPSQPDELGRSVQFFRHNDTNYNIDSNAIVAFGRSAGSEIWSYVVYGPDMQDNTSAIALDQYSSRPNLFVNNIGASYWLDYNQFAVTGAYFNQSKLWKASDDNKLKASATYWINQPNPHLVPVFSIVGASIGSTPPINEIHNPYFAEVLDANIHALDVNNPSTIWFGGYVGLPPQLLIDWIYNNT